MWVRSLAMIRLRTDYIDLGFYLSEWRILTSRRGKLEITYDTSKHSANKETIEFDRLVWYLTTFKAHRFILTFSLAIITMIFVNYGGGKLPMFEHRVWDGLTIADVVFPLFIFASGVSHAISTTLSIRRNETFKRYYESN